jgi:hypothetical protein
VKRRGSELVGVTVVDTPFFVPFAVIRDAMILLDKVWSVYKRYLDCG